MRHRAAVDLDEPSTRRVLEVDPALSPRPRQQPGPCRWVAVPTFARSPVTGTSTARAIPPRGLDHHAGCALAVLETERASDRSARRRERAAAVERGSSFALATSHAFGSTRIGGCSHVHPRERLRFLTLIHVASLRASVHTPGSSPSRRYPTPQTFSTSVCPVPPSRSLRRRRDACESSVRVRAGARYSHLETTAPPS